MAFNMRLPDFAARLPVKYKSDDSAHHYTDGNPKHNRMCSDADCSTDTHTNCCPGSH